MTTDEAIAWCRDEQITISFVFVYGHPRVKAKAPGYPAQERDSFEEACAAAKAVQAYQRKRMGLVG